MKKLSFVFIVAGILVFLYPIYTYYSGVNAEKKLLAQWEEERLNVEAAKNFNKLEEVFLSNEEGEPAELELTQEPQTEPEDVGANIKNLVGIIEIEKISVKLPILSSASVENLKKGAGHVKGTGKLGEVGNAAIAAHRSRTYGRQFNRLDELKVGDEISITTKGESFTYVIFEKKVVNPTDVYVLNKMGDKRVLTLITCDPVVEATHRLILHAEVKL